MKRNAHTTSPLRPVLDKSVHEANAPNLNKQPRQDDSGEQFSFRAKQLSRSALWKEQLGLTQKNVPKKRDLGEKRNPFLCSSCRELLQVLPGPSTIVLFWISCLNEEKL